MLTTAIEFRKNIIFRKTGVSLLLAIFFLISTLAPLLVFVQNTGAEPTFDEYATTSGYSFPHHMVATTSPSPSVWYSVRGSSGNPDTIASISATGVSTEYSTTPSGYMWMNVSEMTADSNGGIWFFGCARPNSGANRMVAGKMNPSTGGIEAVHVVYPICDWTTFRPGPITADSNGNVWIVVDSPIFSDHLYKITSSGGMSGVYTWSNLASSGIAVDSNGNVWLDSSGDIRKLTISSGAVVSQDVYTPPNPTEARSLISGPDGNIWFVNTSYSKIVKLSPGGVFAEYPLASGSNPQSLTVGSDGALWFTEHSANKIGRITVSGSITEYAIPTASSNPIGIVSGSDGALWFAESGANKIGRFGY